MLFEKSIEIEASVEACWGALSDVEAWPRDIETVDSVEIVGPTPLTAGSRVRLKQPKLPEGIWEITTWDPPHFFEWRQKSGGVTSTAGHRITALDDRRCRLDLSLDMQGLLVPVVARLSKGLIERYMAAEAGAVRRVALAGP